MASSSSQKNGKVSTKQNEQELFAAFPEPQGWALNWDWIALQAPPTVLASNPKPKSQPRP